MGVLESTVYQDYEPTLHRRTIGIVARETHGDPVMKADSHPQVDPSTMCVVDAKSAFDHLVSGVDWGSLQDGQRRSLCVIRRSMRTLRARCRWVLARADGCQCLDEEALATV